MFLVGNQQHMLDDKNRIRLPAKHREALGNKYILMPGTSGCIFVYPASDEHKLIAAIENADSFDPDTAEWVRSVAEFSSTVEADSQGRFMLTQELMDICGIKKNVRIVGAITKVEIWSEERYAARRSNMDLTQAGFDERYRKIHDKMNPHKPC